MTEHRCSAKGCDSPAAHDLVWRNPRIHGPERRKVWTACEEHRSSLGDFLASRGFPLEIHPHDPGVDRSA